MLEAEVSHLVKKVPVTIRCENYDVTGQVLFFFFIISLKYFYVNFNINIF